jgi:hypothetical protein
MNDSSLAGIKKVMLVMTDVDAQLGPTTVAQLEAATQLELRKAGIRVVLKGEGKADMEGTDAVLQIGLFGRRRALTNDLELGMRVRQWATVARTQKSGWYDTWTFEKRIETPDSRRDAPPLVTQGVNEFLSHWLDMNGR